MQRRRGLSAGLAALAMAILGCGGGGADPPTAGAGESTGATTAVPSQAPATPVRPCDYLDEEDVTAAMGTSMTITSSNTYNCFFDLVDHSPTEDETPSVIVSVPQNEGGTLPQGLARQCSGLDVVPLSGGRFACHIEDAGWGVAPAMPRALTVTVNGLPDDRAEVDAAAEMAPALHFRADS